MQHNPPKKSNQNAIGWAFILNAGFTLIELVGGLLTNSTAILADAVHDLGDSLAIAGAWYLSWLAGRDADETFTYGYQRLSLFSAVINGTVLIAGSAWVLWQAVPRLADPVLPQVDGMFALALLGITVNGFAAFKLSRGKRLNERVLNWHLLEDVLGWVAVLLVSLALMVVEWPILDPLLAIGFTLFVLFNVSRTTRDALQLFFQAAPGKDLIRTIRDQLLALDEVASVHHEHAWSLDGESHVYTAHLRLSRTVDTERQTALKRQVARILAPYNFAHTTIELELAEEDCRDDGPAS